jgi:transposase InsO family protein
VHHSDRGPQYAGDDFRDICRDNGIERSMSARGSYYDNAVVESFFASWERERCQRTQYKTREDAKADIFDYIARFYNRKRPHSYLDYLTPPQYGGTDRGDFINWSEISGPAQSAGGRHKNPAKTTGFLCQKTRRSER